MLITGVAGFIGSNLVKHFQCHGLDNYSREELLGKEVGDNFDLVKYECKTLKPIDIRTTEIYDYNKEDLNVIIHCAAQTAVTSSLKDPRTDFEVNAIGTFNLLEMARKNDSKFIYTSTNKVYGDNVNDFELVEKKTRYEFKDIKGISEDCSIDLTGHSPYGCSKLSADLYVQEYAKTYGLKTGVFRMSCIYGENQLGCSDQGWVDWFKKRTYAGKPITIYGNGKQVRDTLNVKDLVNLFDLFIKSNKTGVYNVGGGPNNTISLLELLDKLPKTEIKFSDWRNSDQKVYISDISKVKKEFGWEPKVGVEEIWK
jgi:CDP-paratose 2-epimerase